REHAVAEKLALDDLATPCADDPAQRRIDPASTLTERGVTEPLRESRRIDDVREQNRRGAVSCLTRRLGHGYRSRCVAQEPDHVRDRRRVEEGCGRSVEEDELALCDRRGESPHGALAGRDGFVLNGENLG